MQRLKQPCFTLLCILILINLSCDFIKPESEPDRIIIFGTVRYFTIEGGFYAIKGDDGINYDPIGLESPFQINGIRVQVFAIIRNDLGGFHQVGPIIEIKFIRRINNPVETWVG